MAETWGCTGVGLCTETLGDSGPPPSRGQAARRKAMLVQLQERHDLLSTGRLLPPQKGWLMSANLDLGADHMWSNEGGFGRIC